MIKVIPIFFNRGRLMGLSFSLLRERVIYNNSLKSYESVPGYGTNLDYYFMDEAMKNEKTLAAFKLDSPQIISSLVNLLQKIDSPEFCSKTIG